ncbi:MAG: hypothetical protein KGL42_11880 [Betaproteobacteria bacterium]|nr:hypothetical protein [Betaproteobacteria bacterium]
MNEIEKLGQKDLERRAHAEWRTKAVSGSLPTCAEALGRILRTTFQWCAVERLGHRIGRKQWTRCCLGASIPAGRQ